MMKMEKDTRLINDFIIKYNLISIQKIRHADEYTITSCDYYHLHNDNVNSNLWEKFGIEKLLPFFENYLNEKHIYMEKFDINSLFSQIASSINHRTYVLNTNFNVILFKNGVYDLHSKIFRLVKILDFLTESRQLNYNYIPLNISLNIDNKKLYDEFHDFLNEIFPDQKIKNYFLDQVAELLDPNIYKKSLIHNKLIKIFVFLSIDDSIGKTTIRELMIETFENHCYIALYYQLYPPKKPFTYIIDDNYEDINRIQMSHNKNIPIIVFQNNIKSHKKPIDVHKFKSIFMSELIERYNLTSKSVQESNSICFDINDVKYQLICLMTKSISIDNIKSKDYLSLVICANKLKMYDVLKYFVLKMDEKTLEILYYSMNKLCYETYQIIECCLDHPCNLIDKLSTSKKELLLTQSIEYGLKTTFNRIIDKTKDLINLNNGQLLLYAIKGYEIEIIKTLLNLDINMNYAIEAIEYILDHNYVYGFGHDKKNFAIFDLIIYKNTNFVIPNQIIERLELINYILPKQIVDKTTDQECIISYECIKPNEYYYQCTNKICHVIIKEVFEQFILIKTNSQNNTIECPYCKSIIKKNVLYLNK